MIGNQRGIGERHIDMTTSRRFLLALLAGVVVLAAACGDSDETISASGGGADAPGVDGREFWSVDVTENGSPRELVEGTRITLRFDGDQLGASAGCNSIHWDRIDTTLTKWASASSRLAGRV